MPADVTAWQVMDLDGQEQPVNLQEPIQSPVGRSLAPSELATIELHFVGNGLPNPSLPFRFRGRVEYRGVASATYSTDFDAERVGEVWTTQGPQNEVRCGSRSRWRIHSIAKTQATSSLTLKHGLGGGLDFYLLRKQASLYLMDESGTTRAVLGHTKIERPATGVIEQLPASSLVLFDKEAKVVWKAP